MPSKFALLHYGESISMRHDAPRSSNARDERTPARLPACGGRRRTGARRPPWATGSACRHAENRAPAPREHGRAAAGHIAGEQAQKIACLHTKNFVHAAPARLRLALWARAAGEWAVDPSAAAQCRGSAGAAAADAAAAAGPPQARERVRGPPQARKFCDFRARGGHSALPRAPPPPQPPPPPPPPTPPPTTRRRRRRGRSPQSSSPPPSPITPASAPPSAPRRRRRSRRHGHAAAPARRRADAAGQAAAAAVRMSEPAAAARAPSSGERVPDGATGTAALDATAMRRREAVRVAAAAAARRGGR